MLAPGENYSPPLPASMNDPIDSDPNYPPEHDSGGSKDLHHPQPQLPVNGVTLHFPSHGTNLPRGFHLPPLVAPPMSFDTTWQLSPATAQMAYDMVFNRQPSPSGAMRPQVMRMQEGLGQLASLGNPVEESAFHQHSPHQMHPHQLNPHQTQNLNQHPSLIENLTRNPNPVPLTVALIPSGDLHSPIDVNAQPSDSAGPSEELDEDEIKPSVSGRKRDAQGGEDSGSGRKKLKLTKEQAEMLENAFRENNTLNPTAKSSLSANLSLRPRQVEVWFQNRRARTKLKQTEVDCEVLKRCCETLTEENRRLQKELSELRAAQEQSGIQDFLGQMSAATLSMCPSCERLTAIDPVRGPVIINRGNNQFNR